MKQPTRLTFHGEKLYDLQKQQHSKNWSEFELYQENGCVTLLELGLDSDGSITNLRARYGQIWGEWHNIGQGTQNVKTGKIGNGNIIGIETSE